MITRSTGEFTLIDPQLPAAFYEAKTDNLQYAFSQAEQVTPYTIIVIPSSYTRGEGKGYLLDLMALMDAPAALHKIPLHRFGVPVNELVWVIANFDFSGTIKGVKSKGIPVTKVNFLRHHTNIRMKTLRQNTDLISQGFQLSKGRLFDSRGFWVEERPIVQDKKTHAPRLLSDAECKTLFGDSLTASIPDVVYEAISKKINS